MPRYYFHIRDQAGLVQDEEGVDLENLEAAQEEAHASIRELAADRLKARQKFDDLEIEVVDEQGAVIEAVRAREIIR